MHEPSVRAYVPGRELHLHPPPLELESGDGRGVRVEVKLGHPEEDSVRARQGHHQDGAVREQRGHANHHHRHKGHDHEIREERAPLPLPSRKAPNHRCCRTETVMLIDLDEVLVARVEAAGELAAELRSHVLRRLKVLTRQPIRRGT